MGTTASERLRAPISVATAFALAAALVVTGLSVALAPSAVAAPPPGLSPVAQRDPESFVTADALPTAQINGVVWSQALVGNTVYAGGNFTSARPAGSAPGANTVTRSNLLSFDVRTGVLSSFAPTFNGQILSVAASPDGSRLYVGGEFTRVNNQVRNRVAAFDTATGALVTTFAPNMDARVRSIWATNSTVYVGGSFTRASGVVRSRAAAFVAGTGAVTTWNPDANENVHAIVGTTDGSKVVIGGRFTTVGGADAYGMAAVHPATGARLPWATTDLIRNAGPDSAILSLKADGDQIYGTGYHFGAGGNIEGIFSADQTTGAVTWVEDCHGDTYDIAPVGDYVYSAGHAHYCGNVGGFPETNPRTFYRALAFTKEITGTVGHDPHGYFDYFGNPSPSLVNWFPTMPSGTFTGQSQGPWSVVANDRYVVMGGEFPSVNGVGQQGLVRYAIPAAAPSDQGPRLSGSNFVPRLASLTAGTVRVAFTANHDRDDKTLTYRVIRNGNTANPVHTVTADSTFWKTPALGFTDSGLTPGSTVSYRLQAVDPDGNTVTGNTVSVTVASGDTSSDYSDAVLGDGAEHFWRLGEPSGSVGFDWAGFEDLTVGSAVTRGATGAIGGDSNTASTFDGTPNSRTVNPVPVQGPDVFTLEAWIRTTTTDGGKIVGFGNSATGESNNYDRHLYMNPDGRVTFGVYNNASYTVDSPAALNDGEWHQVVGVMGPTGLSLYVDGKRVGTNGGTSVGQNYVGYWRIGGDSPWSGAAYFNGSIDDVAVYPGQLSKAQIQEHYTLSGRTLPPGLTPPSDTYGATVYADEPELYYRLDETGGTTAADLSGNGNDADYAGGVTVGVPSPVTDAAGASTAFNGSDGTLASRTLQNGPSVYSEELWFKTTTTRGGKLIGFGNTRSGYSGNYDRHVYMEDSGQLTFGVWTGQTNTITSPSSYNDGEWHHLVATQGSDGLKLYVDKQLVGTHPQTSQQGYAGYWRIGGDTAWGGSSAFFDGTIDEVAVYARVLDAATVAEHFDATPLTDVNDAPVARIAAPTVDALTADLDGSGSTDADGDALDFDWEFGDGSTGSGATVSHTYGSASTYTVTLTVTDPDGLSDSTTVEVTTTAVNQAPDAAFQFSTAELVAEFDATGSTDPESGALTYAWDFGDGATGSGATPSHTYGAGGTYPVELTVTDPGGRTDSVTRDVTVTAPNQAPDAAFTVGVSGLEVTADAAGSSDPDGSVASYAWDFGDGDTGNGVSPTHTYAAAGTYTITLTVTDDDGALDTASRDVTVTSVTVFAADSFTRSTTTGWGSAETGGLWSFLGGSTLFSVTGNEGAMRLNAPGSGPTAILASAGAADVDATVDVTLSSVPTGGGTFVALAARRQSTNDYRTQVKFTPTATNLQLIEVRNNAETTLGTVAVTGVRYEAGQTYRIRLRVTGSATPELAAKVWRVGTTEPTGWQITRTDATTPLSGAGGIALKGYLSGSSAVSPVTVRFDNLGATSPQ